MPSPDHARGLPRVIAGRYQAQVYLRDLRAPDPTQDPVPVTAGVRGGKARDYFSLAFFLAGLGQPSGRFLQEYVLDSKGR
jgi:hypothetical protein